MKRVFDLMLIHKLLLHPQMVSVRCALDTWEPIQLSVEMLNHKYYTYFQLKQDSQIVKAEIANFE